MRTRFAVATAAYPTNLDFIAQFVQGLEFAARKHDKVRLVVVSEYGFDAATVFDPLPAGLILDVRAAPGPTSPAGLRRLMIEACRQSDAENVVFCDFDDWLLPDALDLHGRALENADISYGSQVLVNEKGESLNREFPDCANLPAEVDGPSAVRAHNFMGFSNTAVRQDALAQSSIAIPEHLAAPDWWFYTMLLASGCRARRAAAVTSYRVYAQSVLGAKAATSVAMLHQRAKIAGRHYAAIGGVVDVTPEQEMVSRLLALIENDPEAADEIVAKLPPNVAWFDDVSTACAMLGAACRPAR